MVHGHDEAAKEAVARFIEKLDLKVTILHEQPNAGRTIIEKFEAHSSVNFAVILLTPDDVGAPREKSTDGQARARQNVIFELGYFTGNWSPKSLRSAQRQPGTSFGYKWGHLYSAGCWRSLAVGSCERDETSWSSSRFE